MNAALQRCGFNAPTVTWLIAQGFATPNDLMLATESDLDSIARSVARSAPRGAGNVTMPFIAVKNLKGFRFWADERKRTGFEANPESFTADKVPEFTAKCQEYQEQKEAAKTKMHPSLTVLRSWSTGHCGMSPSRITFVKSLVLRRSHSFTSPGTKGSARECS
ncbi:hypothetical protein MHU86_4794 [Fragilaria crotonensis]|nr:hypothetical protein MHU86_10847 [Fragilaria crotonensis]KAI2509674.1 hypothetical protein MHU86_4794 [Fragilaria crotonensis]